MPKERYIIHVDMDAFFASIEQRNKRGFRGKPVIVGADPKNGKGRGVVSTCSYEAREFGIHSAMPISSAYRKCPDAVFLPVDMPKYHVVSCQIHRIFYEFTPRVEPFSIDEAFLDISGSYHLFGTPYETALLLKSRIKEDTGLTASIGLAPNKLTAKIASNLKKPDGMVEVKPGDLPGFLWPLDISQMWGVGKKGATLLNNIGVKTIGDLAGRKVEELKSLLGKNAEFFLQLANGIDTREVETKTHTKSISNEITFEQDTFNREKIKSTLMWLCEKVSDRLSKEGLRGKSITLKIRMDSFKTYTRSVNIYKPTNFVDILFKETERMYDSFGIKQQKIRLLGVKVSKFNSPEFQLDLFSKGDNKRENIHKAVGTIKNKFGDKVIYRAGSMLR